MPPHIFFFSTGFNFQPAWIFNFDLEDPGCRQTILSLEEVMGRTVRALKRRAALGAAGAAGVGCRPRAQEGRRTERSAGPAYLFFCLLYYFASRGLKRHNCGELGSRSSATRLLQSCHRKQTQSVSQGLGSLSHGVTWRCFPRGSSSAATTTGS